MKACAMIGAVDMGNKFMKRLQGRVVQNDIFLVNVLVDTYQLWWSQMPNGLPSQTVLCWNALITAYAQGYHTQQALESEGMLPDAVTYTCILKACATIGPAVKGKQIRDEIARQSLHCAGWCSSCNVVTWTGIALNKCSVKASFQMP
ncbi:hypothetical protein GOP47_0028677 [Adiantum capillus-veneris]|nr:hypothetical protein GOP47_0028677 [Adiantum capillus-veneris]